MSPRTKTILRWAFCIIAAAALVYGLCAGLARPAEPVPGVIPGSANDCTITHPLQPNKFPACPDHISVPAEYLADLLAAQDTLAKRDAELRAEKENHATDVERLEGELAGVQKARQDCEASRVCPKPEQPGLFAQPGFSWPVGLAGGFIGGLIASRPIFPCR